MIRSISDIKSSGIESIYVFDKPQHRKYKKFSVKDIKHADIEHLKDIKHADIEHLFEAIKLKHFGYKMADENQVNVHHKLATLLKRSSVGEVDLPPLMINEVDEETYAKVLNLLQTLLLEHNAREKKETSAHYLETGKIASGKQESLQGSDLKGAPSSKGIFNAEGSTPSRKAYQSRSEEGREAAAEETRNEEKKETKRKILEKEILRTEIKRDANKHDRIKTEILKSDANKS